VRIDPGVAPDAFTRFQLVHLVVEAIAGALIGGGAVLVSVVGRHRLGWTLAYFGMLVLITLADLISFYVRQFDSLFVVLLHLVLLAAVIGYRDQLRAEPVHSAHGRDSADRVAGV
jgi:hypothetical protein